MYKYHAVSLESIRNSNVTIGVVTFFSNSTMAILLNSDNIFEIGEKIIVKVYDKLKGILVFEAYVASFNEKKIFLEDILYVKELERRTSHRITINIPVEISRFINNDNEVITLEKAIFMRGKNISLDGILFESFLDLPDDIKFIVDLPLKRSTILITTTTARKYLKDKYYYYGCKIEFPNIEDKYILKKFIYENYRMQIKYRKPRLSS